MFDIGDEESRHVIVGVREPPDRCRRRVMMALKVPVCIAEGCSSLRSPRTGAKTVEDYGAVPYNVLTRPGVQPVTPDLPDLPNPEPGSNTKAAETLLPCPSSSIDLTLRHRLLCLPSLGVHSVTPNLINHSGLFKCTDVNGYKERTIDEFSTQVVFRFWNVFNNSSFEYFGCFSLR